MQCRNCGSRMTVKLTGVKAKLWKCVRDCGVYCAKDKKKSDWIFWHEQLPRGNSLGQMWVLEDGLRENGLRESRLKQQRGA